MGQAAVDLPSSSDKTPAPLQSADDLLSQMAGAEIDRMLADADEEKDGDAAKAAAKVATAEASAATAPAHDAYKAEVDELFRQLDSVPLAPPAKPPVPAQALAAPQPIEAKAEPAPAPLEASESESEPDPAPAATAQPTVEPPQDQPSAENTPPAQPPAPIDVAAAIEIAVKEVEKERAGLFVRILELINAPFASCPDAVRELLGKLAILTLMNSMGVLLYIVLFRK